MARTEGDRHFGQLPLFQPQQGTTVRTPLDSGPGWWAGAPGALHDSELKRFFVCYRLRKPRELGRGAMFRIAESRDGIAFDDVWQGTRDDLDSPSVERNALVRLPDGRFAFYISFVDPADGRWRIDVVTADHPSRFDLSTRQKVFSADDINGEGVKDPFVYHIGGVYHMIVSYAPHPEAMTDQVRDVMHATGDIYNTGTSKSCSGVATSLDGLVFTWEGDIMSPTGEGWDAYATRIGALVWTPPVFTAFYDGSHDVSQNYEERTGMAVTWDLRHYTKLTPDGPCLVSPHASGGLRYIDVLRVDGRLYYYYEMARPDGSHDLRVAVV